ncbi:histidine phosphatase family protein [Sutcliffiella halmapala]|uniref:histidine phosphatase family protein n=1 Tax=Sutcliffiella halmapala TaxID=79882 RepID=UPI0009951CD8|nr:histidine phosphatase family protein [Sutcliffiella halmapala]
MNTHIYFVRHAHSAYTPDELMRALSVRGMEDAKGVAEILRKENIDVVLSSPYKRAIQTVEGVAKIIESEIKIVDGFKERTLASGMLDNFQEAIEKVWQETDFSWEGGESNEVAQKRGITSLLKTLDTYKGKRVVVGTHGNIMVLIMNYFAKKYDYEFWKTLVMPDIYKLTFNNKELVSVERVWENYEK